MQNVVADSRRLKTTVRTIQALCIPKTLGAGAGILLFPAAGRLRGACDGGMFSESTIDLNFVTGLDLGLGFLVDIGTFVDVLREVGIALCVVGIGIGWMVGIEFDTSVRGMWQAAQPRRS